MTSINDEEIGKGQIDDMWKEKDSFKEKNQIPCG